MQTVRSAHLYFIARAKLRNADKIKTVFGHEITIFF